MGSLLILLILVLVIILVARGKKTSVPTLSAPDEPWDRRQYDAGWVSFIASYRKDATTKAEKKLVEKMLADLAAQGFGTPQISYQSAQQPLQQEETAIPALDMVQSRQEALHQQVDNVSLLLYFGAFLFVASVGLFVAFGGFPGAVRTLAVALVALVLYGAGVWLFKNKPKLEQAGLAFAGIGIATAPFVGLAAYSFVFDHSFGALVWFTTSLACLTLYVHALFVLRKPLLNYVLIFTFLSLVLSGISVASAPLYYFGWGLAAVGLLLSVISRQPRFDRPFQDASSSSAKVLVPLASAASLVMIYSQGAGQLGVSLLLAAAFYATEFAYGTASARTENASASQVAATAATGLLAYGFGHEFWQAAAAIVGLNAVLMIVVVLRARRTELWHNFSSIILLSGVVAVFLGVWEPMMVMIGLLALVVNGLIVWRKQTRADTYGLAVIAWMVLSLVIGQYYLQPSLTAAEQTVLSLAALMVQWLLVVGFHRSTDSIWLGAAKALYILSAAVVLYLALGTSPLTVLVVAAITGGSMAMLAEYCKDTDWAAAAGFAIALPVLPNVDNYGWFAASVLIALIANIAIAVRYRLEVIRWLGSILWFILPLALGKGLLGNWTPAEFGWAYMVVLAGFVLARSIARGMLFVSSRAPVSSYEKTASRAYVVGYCLAIASAVPLSLFGQSRFHTSAVLVLLGVLVWLLASTIERRPGLYIWLPAIAQALLLSSMRPDVSSRLLDGYLLASSALAALGYAVFMNREPDAKGAVAFRDGSLMVAVIAPFSYVVVQETHLMMPIGLLVFTAMLYYHQHRAAQANKEWIGGLGLAAIWWLLWFMGVRNPQAYSHVLAALFAAYAYWRHYRHETKTSDRYLVAMLATATVPLILQRFSGTAGDLYGWWLLIEQVAFMLLGMAIGKPFVVRWGLYVAVGAVIYQLRGLGWAALTVLALFLIGLAIYRLQKQDKQK